MVNNAIKTQNHNYSLWNEIYGKKYTWLPHKKDTSK
jgi:hypothetical protein